LGVLASTRHPLAFSLLGDAARLFTRAIFNDQTIIAGLSLGKTLSYHQYLKLCEYVSVPISIVKNQDRKLFLLNFKTLIKQAHALEPNDKQLYKTEDGYYLSKASYGWRRMESTRRMYPQELAVSFDVAKAAGMHGLARLIKSLDGKDVLQGVQLLSKVSDYAKRYASALPGDVIQYFNAEQIYGHFTLAQSPDFNPDSEAVKLLSPKTFDLDSEALVDKKAVYLLDKMTPGDLPSFRSWLERYTWATSGAVLGFDFSGTKGQLSESETIDWIISEIEATREFKISPVVKLEPSKVRLALNVDARSVILSLYLLDGILGADWTTLGLSDLQQIESTTRFADDGQHKLPADYKTWDARNVRRKTQLVLLRRLMRRVPAGDRELVSKVYELDYFYNNKQTGVRVRWEDGMISGAGWTSVFNSIINKATSDTSACRSGLVLGIMSQGDDVLLKGRLLDLVKWQLQTTRDGYLLNPRKSYLEPERYEFLRRQFSGNLHITTSVNMYPTRQIPTIIQRRPWASEGESAVTRITTLLSNLISLNCRTQRPLDYSLVTRECARAGIPDLLHMQMNGTGVALSENGVVIVVARKFLSRGSHPMYRTKEALTRTNFSDMLKRRIVAARQAATFTDKVETTVRTRKTAWSTRSVQTAIQPFSLPSELFWEGLRLSETPQDMQLSRREWQRWKNADSKHVVASLNDMLKYGSPVVNMYKTNLHSILIKQSLMGSRVTKLTMMLLDLPLSTLKINC
jgi:hypothetical protein